MATIFCDLQERTNPRNGELVPADDGWISRLLASLQRRPPFMFELRRDDGSVLTVGVSPEHGVAQYAGAVGSPPHFVAMAEDGGEPEVLGGFLAGGTPTEVPGEYLLSSRRLVEVIEYFVAEGGMLPGLVWVEI